MNRTEHLDTRDFQSPDEERQYWETRGPLAEGRKGRISRSSVSQKRSSILAVRLTGEELTRLRDVASKQGLGPSTFARSALLSAIAADSRSATRPTADELFAKLPQDMKHKLEAFVKETAIGDLQNPSLFIIDSSQMKAIGDLTLSLLGFLLAQKGVEVITPNNENYQKVRELVKAR